MKQLTKFQANDGVLFDSELDAIARDDLIAECERLEQSLPPHPEESTARVRHDPAVLATYRQQVVELCRRLYPGETVFTHPHESIHPFSWAGRFLSEVAPACVNKLWFRLSCCHDGYEYEQPFFALHPQEWKDPVEVGGRR